MLVEEREHDRFVELLVTVSVTVPAKLSTGDTVIVELLDEPALTASDRRSRSNRPADVPSDLPSRWRSFAVAESSCQAPIRNVPQSTANNRSSKHIRDPA